MKTVTRIGDGFGVEDIFDLESAYVEHVAGLPRDNRKGVFHPSAVGMCGRRNVYEYISTPGIETIDPDDREVFDIGHAIHGLVQGRFSAMAAEIRNGVQFEVRCEVPYDRENDVLYRELKIGGTCDVLIKIFSIKAGWEQHGVIEIKSIKDDNYNKLSGPKQDHVMQAHIYAYRFNTPIIWLWYYNKDRSKRRIYPVVFDPKILDAALARYEGWLKHAEAGTLPEREESWWACPRCEYRKTCNPGTLAKSTKNVALDFARSGKILRIPWEE